MCFPTPFPAARRELVYPTQDETTCEETAMAEPSPNPETMLAKDLYVIVTRPVVPREQIMEVLPAHLERQVELEKQGILFAAGPLFDEDGTPTSGMIVVRANSFKEANEIAMGDPFHAKGLREFTIQRWRVNEGSYTVTVNYSDQSMRLG